ncbi:MAG: hypothetical protein WAT61_05895 [Flavobacteriales bacterium]
MEYCAALLADRSKVNIQRIADHIGGDAKRFAQLMELVLHGAPRVSQLASWPMSIACEGHPALGARWAKRMLEMLEQPLHQTTHRNVIRAMQFCQLPKALHGTITQRMFAIVQDPRQPIASRASSITVAMRMATRYPDLAPELSLILEDALRTGPGPAVTSRARKALHTLARTR